MTDTKTIPCLCRCRVRFQLLPTAYGFAAGHCVRLAISGADAKHFSIDHEGDRTMWIHTGQFLRIAASSVLMVPTDGARPSSIKMKTR